MKTAITYLIHKWESELGSYIPNAPIYQSFINDAKIALLPEQNQIANAYEHGAYDFQCKKIEVTNGDGIEYYNEHFTPKINNEDRYHLKKAQLLAKFDSKLVKEQYNSDPMFHAVIESLMDNECDPYSIIEELIIDRKRICSEMENILMNNITHSIPKQ